jgi:hypothetical protein
MTPFCLAASAAGPDKDAPAWRRSFDFPSAEQLMEPELRLNSSGFRFLDTLRAYICAWFRDGFSLPSRIAEYLHASGCRSISGTPLYQWQASLSVPSVSVAGGSAAAYVMSSGIDDALALNHNWPNTMGQGRLSAYVQVQLFLPAAEIIFYPNERMPTTPLGRAWQAYQARPWPGRAFQTVTMPREGAP